MNTKYFLITVLIFCCMPFVKAQYVTLYTPMGSPVEGFIRGEELSDEEIEAINNEYITSYPQAIFLDDATTTYNCHSYAWNISAGGTTVCWINQYDHEGEPNISKYWTDGSYQSTTENLAYKIFYYNGDHSATRSSVAGYYESKWGSAPLMRHAPGYGPSSYNMSSRRYYIAQVHITGPTSLSLPSSANYVTGSFTATPVYNTAIGDYEWSVTGPGTANIYDNRSSATIDFYRSGNYYVTCGFRTSTGQIVTAPYTLRVMVMPTQSYSLIFDASSKTIALVSQGDKTQAAASAMKGYAYQIANLSTGALVANGLIAPDGSKISVATLQPGIYVCKIQIDAETTLIEKLIIR